jgi:alkylated DNA repair dioxygenase AlkB
VNLETQHFINLLPRDGTVVYYPSFLTHADSAQYFHTLLNSINWKNDEVFLFGKHYVTGRKVAWYGDSQFAYTYSSKTKVALPWTPELRQLRELTEKITGLPFNSCLLNLYHDGTEGMGWHSDDEKTLGINPAIASVSLGSPRKFSLKHKSGSERISVMLENGSLLLMKDETQHHWLHSLPKSGKVTLPRINLTFRYFKSAEK